MNFEKGSENRELYLNTTQVISDISPKKGIFPLMVNLGIFERILDQLSSTDELKVVSTCKIISILIA